MSLIRPNFLNSGTTIAQKPPPPWARGPAFIQQASEVPWRKNLKTGGVGTNAQKSSPAAPQSTEQGQPKSTKLQINLKSVKKPDGATQPANDKLPPVQLNPVLPDTKVATNTKPPTGKTIPITIQKADSKPPPPTTTIPIQRPHNDPPKTTVIKTESKMKKVEPNKPPPSTPKKMVQDKSPAPPAPPAPPPMPKGQGPPPPPPPPPPGGPNAGLPPKPPHVKAKIEQLKKAPRKRPDWSTMMKEIETGRKLKRVQCNDRSKPILPRMKSCGKFVFESEAKPATKSDALHNKLLNEIQGGVKLKRVQCNDRSKPILSGLRIRRQSSVAETDVQKASTNLIPEPEELAFVMDIDVLRDELQSAKQMLEMEIETKHNVEKKNRDQKCQIIAMEAEIETLKAKLGLIPEDECSMLTKGLGRSDSKTFNHLKKSGSGLWKSPSIVGIKKSKSGISKDLPPKPTQDKGGESQQQQGQQAQQQQNEDELIEVNEMEEEISSLKQTVQHARKQAEEMEKKYKEAMDKLLVAQAPPIVQTAERTTQTEEQILDRMMTRQQSTRDDAQDGFSGSEEDDSDMEVDEETLQRKKQDREVKLWENKLKSMKEKQHSSRLERRNLKNLQKKFESELKEAKKRHKKLQREVDKMAKMLKEAEKDEDEENEDEEEEEEPEPEKEEEESDEEEESEEEESESESEEEDEESSEEDDEDAPHDDRLAVYGKRIKRRENVLNALRKGNYLLRANIDRLKDDLEEARIAYHDLEHELSSCVDEM
ncbi:hypothetical protein Ocin01_06400 [Orchesella cincta]|uniref:WH2 domain-containing protein n=1 Tax=Orchesella cincta TaxID=48709 RepID=A0A1D2N5F3_ORCCI|nr:hypothetical protein Ocin01_06400 [Orchesella cincta]